MLAGSPEIDCIISVNELLVISLHYQGGCCLGVDNFYTSSSVDSPCKIEIFMYISIIFIVL